MKMFSAKTLVVPVAAVALVLAGCSGGGQTGGGDTGGGTPATGDPIVVASIATMTFFPEGPPAAKAVFDDYNASGGFNGRPIEFKVFDDKADPSASQAAANDALKTGAVALVGNSSVLDCAVNHTTWVKEGIVAIQAIGVDPFCFATPNIAPVNTGPWFDSFATLWDGSETMGFKKICGFSVVDDAAGAAALQQAVGAWEKSTGKKLAFMDGKLVRGQASYAGNLAAVSKDKCDSLFINETGPAVTAFLAEAAQQGIELPVLALTSTYSQDFADSLAGVYNADVFVPAEFSPWSDENDASNKTWRATMEKHNIGFTSFAQGGYLSAKAFIHILESVKGDVTRESFTAAAKGMTEANAFDTGGITGEKWIFGPGDAHQPNATAWPVKLEAGAGKWTSVGPWFMGRDKGWVDTTIPKA